LKYGSSGFYMWGGGGNDPYVYFTKNAACFVLYMVKESPRNVLSL
jgi:hypothetical protein